MLLLTLALSTLSSPLPLDSSSVSEGRPHATVAPLPLGVRARFLVDPRGPLTASSAGPQGPPPWELLWAGGYCNLTEPPPVVAVCLSVEDIAGYNDCVDECYFQFVNGVINEAEAACAAYNDVFLPYWLSCITLADPHCLNESDRILNGINNTYFAAIQARLDDFQACLTDCCTYF